MQKEKLCTIAIGIDLDESLVEVFYAEESEIDEYNAKVKWVPIGQHTFYDRQAAIIFLKKYHLENEKRLSRPDHYQSTYRITSEFIDMKKFKDIKLMQNNILNGPLY